MQQKAENLKGTKLRILNYLCRVIHCNFTQGTLTKGEGSVYR
jgi:hypothetical protein